MAPPFVSVVLAARDAAQTLEEAVRSVLAQAVRDLELVVVDDGSVDRTAEVLASIDDLRLRVLRNAAPLGLAGALNVGLDAARGRYVARMDADDVALPGWLERILARIEASPRVAVVGTGMIDLADRSLGTVHRMPQGVRAVHWAALFSSPFFHSTVLLDRRVLDAHGLRYDATFGESEDYDLWARLLSVADGDNVPEALVLYRKHGAQASAQRAELQRDCRRRVALRQIEALAPQLDARRSELAWRAGGGLPLDPGTGAEAAEALRELVEAFETAHGGNEGRRAAAWALARTPAPDGERAALVRAALRLDPGLPARSLERLRWRRTAREERAAAASWLSATRDEPVRLTMVIPEPTPFRTVMLDRTALRPELDLTVLYAGSTVQRRAWAIEPHHRAAFLEGRRVPGLYRALRHEYPISLGVFGALAGSKPEVVVVSGWSTFASQAAAAWCRPHDVPYVLLVESNERDARPGWRRAVKGAVVPPILRGAAEVLVVGTLARESMLARGVGPERISLFADTIDAVAFAAEADRLRPRRDELRAEAGLRAEDVAVLSIARLAPEKGLDTLVRAVAAAGDPRLVLVLAGSGAERDPLAALAEGLGVRVAFLPDIPWERIAEGYRDRGRLRAPLAARAWGVVVNEAAASGLPLVVSDRVGAAHDLVEDGVNGAIVPAERPRCGRRGDPRARGRPGAPPRSGRRLARDHARLGLRAEHREPDPGGAPRRGPSALERLLVDLQLPVDGRVPRRAPGRAEGAFREARPERRLGEDARDRVDGRPGVVRHDERLAVAERRRDAGAVGDDHGCPDGGGLGRDEPEVLPARGEDEHVRATVEVERGARRGREDVYPAGGRRVGERGPHRVHRAVTVVRAGEHDVDLRKAPRRLEQVLDPLLRGDPADVEHHRRAGGHDSLERIRAGRRAGASGRRSRARGRARHPRRRRRRRPARAARRRSRAARPTPPRAPVSRRRPA